MEFIDVYKNEANVQQKIKIISWLDIFQTTSPLWWVIEQIVIKKEAIDPETGAWLKPASGYLWNLLYDKSPLPIRYFLNESSR